MGTEAHVVVVGGERDLIARAQSRLSELESRWSRFRPTSEVSALNAHRSRPVKVGNDTYELVAHAVRACDLTAGRFDPTILDVMHANGYDRSYEHLADRKGFIVESGIAAPGCSGVRLDPLVSSIALGQGTGFDPGGIGKGLAADIVVRELRAAGAEGVMVNIGGDLAVEGTPPDHNGWIIGIEDPSEPSRMLGRVTVEQGAVCTSSRARRTWLAGDGVAMHHIADPRTGIPLNTDIVSITVVAGAGWWAEACSKALFVVVAEGGLQALDDEAIVHDIHVLTIDVQGTRAVFGGAGVFDLWSDHGSD